MSASSKVIVFFLLLFIICWVVYIFSLFHEPNKKFDKSKWLTEQAKRYEMANDIIESRILIGKDSNQIKQLIGEPDSRLKNSSEYYYNMGMGAGGLGFKLHSLLLKFKNGQVDSVFHGEVLD
jgi:cbb3-type cytochrome oxidase subunit 3